MKNTAASKVLDELLTRVTADDVIGAIFAYSGESRFTTERQALQEFFYRLSKDDQFASLFDEFDFTEDRDLYPFSRVLEATLGRLQMGKVIYARNPDYDSYGMDDASRERMRDLAQEIFSKEQQELLMAAGQELARQSEQWEKRTKQDEGA
jgi:hypothetical protein